LGSVAGCAEGEVVLEGVFGGGGFAGASFFFDVDCVVVVLGGGRGFGGCGWCCGAHLVTMVLVGVSYCVGRTVIDADFWLKWMIGIANKGGGEVGE